MASASSHGHWGNTAGPEVSRKRKDRNVIAAAAHAFQDPIRRAKADLVPPLLPLPPPPQQQQIQAAGGAGGKLLLAGYLAHEFLTKGTLFGRHWDPTAAATPPAVKERHTHRQEDRKLSTPPEVEEEKLTPVAYVEIAYLLKEDGAGIPGVVNPTQLLQWLQM